MRFRKILAALWLLCFLPVLSETTPRLQTFIVEDAGAAYPSAAIPSDFWLNWSFPIRWRTGLPLSYRVTWYEVDDRDVAFSLVNAPSGMAISTNGTITWASPTAGIYAGIQVVLNRSGCDNPLFAGCVSSISRTFTMTVGTSDFLFVATTGNDSNPCSFAAPCAHLSHAMSLISGNDGQTIFVRGGNYTDNWTTGAFAGVDFPASDSMMILPYPGETPNITIATDQGIELDAGTGHVDIAVNIVGSLSPSKGNYLMDGNDVIVHDVITGLSRSPDNSAGLTVGGINAVVSRVVSKDNWEPGKTPSGSAWNNNGILAYNQQPNKTSWVLDSKAYDTEVCFKIKHTNFANSKTVFHNNEAINCTWAFIGSGDDSSFRYGISWKAMRGVELGATDTSSFILGGMLVEHVTAIGKSSTSYNFGIQGGYQTNGTATFSRNISYNDTGGCQDINPDGGPARACFVGWYYAAAATARAYPFYQDYDMCWNPAGDANCFHVGNTGAPASVNLSTYKTFDPDVSLGRDPNTVIRGPHNTISSPGFINLLGGDVQIPVGAGAAVNCGSGTYGSFCGAFKPGRTNYGTVGNQNDTLLEWYSHVASVPTPTPTATPTATPSGSATPTPTSTGTATPTSTSTPDGGFVYPDEGDDCEACQPL